MMISMLTSVSRLMASPVVRLQRFGGRWAPVLDFYNVRHQSSSSNCLHIDLPKEALADRKTFMAFFPKVVEDFATRWDGEDAILRNVFNHQKNVIEYNVPFGKLLRGLTIAASPRILRDSNDVTDEDILLCNIMGWCYEIIIQSVVMSDDIIDNSLIRYGAPCWYTVNNVGLSAINDISNMNCGTSRILKRYFGNKHYYHHLYEALAELNWDICIGQYLDMTLPINREGSSSSLDNFKMENWNSIAKYKTSSSLHLAVEVALRLNGYTDPECFSQTKEIFLPIGYLYQAQDDAIDCFEDPSKTKKLGNDIEEGKMTWVAVKALELANPEQVEILKKNYGKRDPECVKRVKDLYSELNLQEHYANYCRHMCEHIFHMLRRPESKLPESIYLYHMNLFINTDLFLNKSAANVN